LSLAAEAPVAGVPARPKLVAEGVRLFGFVCLATALLASMAWLEPKRRGDGNSYFLVLESLSRHASVDLRLDDIRAFYDGRLNAFGEALPPRMGYYEGLDGQWYSGHFWAYAATSVPAKWALEATSGDPRKAFQLTNGLLFCGLLFAILFTSVLSERQKGVLIVACLASPVLWYLHWSHPEVFIFCFTLGALMALKRDAFSLAVALAAVASLQNQTLVLFVAYLGVCGLLRVRTPRDAGLLALAGAPVLLPPLYNFVHFGKFSILTNWLSSEGMLGRMVDVFFDLNLGLLPYVPVTLGLYFGLLLHSAWRERRFTRDHQLFLVVLAMMCVACMQSNWNNDSSGLNRYAVWMVLPFAFMTLAVHAEDLLRQPLLRAVAGFGALLQLGIIVWLGPFDSQLSYVEHSPAARFVFEHAPALYSPTHEIFCERVSHSEAPCGGLAVYATDRCHKALVRCDLLPELAAACGSIPVAAAERCESAGDEALFYVDY
jgi:hypothetical protein